MTPSELNEEKLVEIPAHQIFQELEYEVQYGPDLHPGRENQERDSISEVLFKSRLKRVLQDKVCPGLPDEAYEIAISQLEALSSPDLIENNRKFHQMLLSGIKVIITNKQGKTEPVLVKFIDFEKPTNNDFLAVRQFVVEQHQRKRADHVVFVNGIPLAILEYKDPTNKNATIKDAYHQLDTDYQRAIPKLFHYNAFCVISDKTKARYGTMTSNFEYFFEWKDPVDKDKKVANQLDVLQRLMFEKKTLLDIIQNYIEFEDDGSKIIKKIAQQHQIEAVNKTVDQSKIILAKKDENRIGVVWHTTGSGKSLTMIFYVQIISQLKEFENPTFVIITDRTDLDEQLSGFFTNAGFPYPRAPTSILEAESVEDLREKLQTPAGKIIFTTIQKFQVTDEEKEGRAKYPKINDRRNIIIIADEAHRSQYKKMAQNLQRALPNALRLGFTGTPIEKEDRSTTDVFGDVISAYRIPDAVRDKATVEIAYEGRQVHLHLLNKFIGKDFDDITQDIDPDTAEALSRKWSEVKKLVEEPERIKLIAEDVVKHFNAKQKVMKGKAMLCATTKKSAAMYKEFIDKIKDHPKNICVISGSKSKTTNELSDEKKTLEDYLRLHYRNKTEIKDLIKNFKDEKNDIQLLIVCDMFLTGFDAPLLHTLYVDKPLRDHNLIQAISRVNRLWKDKPQGLIVDYIGIADDLRKSFKAYAESDVKEAMKPTKEILLYMQKKHTELLSFFTIDISQRHSLPESELVNLMYDAINELVEDEDVKRKFFENVTELTKAYAVCTPHPACQEVEEDLEFFQKLRKIISKSTANAPLISEKMDNALQELVEKGIGADKVIKQFSIQYDPNKTDLNAEYLSKIKKIQQKNLKVELAYKLLDDAIKYKFKRNVIARKSFQERIENALSKYHGRFENFETIWKKLEDVSDDVIAQKKKEEEIGLSEEEYVFYEAISEGKEYAKSERDLKEVAIKLTDFLKRNTTIDWMNRVSIKAKIHSGVKHILLDYDFNPESFDKLLPLIMIQAERNFSVYSDLE